MPAAAGSPSNGQLTSSNASTLRDCFSAELLRRIAAGKESSLAGSSALSFSSSSSSSKARKRLAGKSRKTGKYGKKDSTTELVRAAGTEAVQVGEYEEGRSGNDEEELAEFIDYLSQELFDALPVEIQSLSYSAVQNNAALAARIGSSATGAHSSYVADSLVPLLPPSIAESLTAYALLPTSRTSVANVLTATLESYIASTTAAPPVWSSTRADVDGCEICTRDWLPLTYHHLIPKSTHERVLKRGWHEEWMLNSVAWLCRACHSYVHSIESNEMLAKEFFTVDRLLEREDIKRWASWAKKVRWKAN